MCDDQGPKKKDRWDIADVIGKLLIPLIIVAATLQFNDAQRTGEAHQKTFATAVDILKSPQSSETAQLRSWALAVFQSETRQASAELPKEAIQELQKGSLPSVPDIRLPTSGPLRVVILRLPGTPNDPAEKLKSTLTAGGYTDVTIRDAERDTPLPSKAEVRFYYPADSLNAQALRDYISEKLNFPIDINNRSQDRDASSHRLGDLHVYIR